MAKTILGFNQHTPLHLLWGQNGCCLCNREGEIILLQQRVDLLEKEIKRMTKRIDVHPLPPKKLEFADICRLAVLQDSHCILPTKHYGNHRDSSGFETCFECRGDLATWGHKLGCSVKQ